MSARRSLRSRLVDLAVYVDGVRSCAAALESGRRPSRRAVVDAGFPPEMFDRVRLN